MIPYEWSESLACTCLSQLPSKGLASSLNPGIPVFSPKGDKIAAIVEKTKIVVRDVETLSVVSFLSCVDSPKYIEWSRDGSYILACMPQRSSVSIFCIQGRKDGGNEVTLTETLAGVTFATWSPWNTVALVVSDFGSRMLAWDISSTEEEGSDNQNTKAMVCPSVSSADGVSPSPDGRLLAVLTRKACRDSIVLYSIEECSDIHQWNIIEEIDVGTINASGISWSPDSKSIAVWDAIYAGPRVIVVSVDDDKGRVLMDKSWDSDNGLGVRTVQWSPSGGVLAIGTYDVDVRMVNSVTWKDMDVTLHHDTVIDEQKYGSMVEVFMETMLGDDNPRESADTADQAQDEVHLSVSTQTLTKYTDDIPMPVKLPAPPRPNTKDIMPSIGIERLLWSGTGRYVAAVCQERPHVAWIWDATTLKLDTVLVHKSPIRDLAWRPHACDTLYLVCGNKNVYVWADGAATCVNTCIEDDKFRGHALQWAPNGAVLHACGRESYSLGFFDMIPQA